VEAVHGGQHRVRGQRLDERRRQHRLAGAGGAGEAEEAAAARRQQPPGPRRQRRQVAVALRWVPAGGLVLLHRPRILPVHGRGPSPALTVWTRPLADERGAAGLAALVRNRTLSPEAAAILWTAAAEERSFVVMAMPRLAGKTTMMRSALACAPPGTPLREFAGGRRQVEALLGSPPRGYLVVAEVSPDFMPGYLWGEPARRAFELVGSGFALATTMHARGVDECFAILCRYNRVPDRLAAGVRVTVHIEVFPPWWDPRRRVVDAIHEVEGVEGGRPRARLLHRWDAAADRFELVDLPRGFGTAASVSERAALLA
jgi:hypothetical protein